MHVFPYERGTLKANWPYNYTYYIGEKLTSIRPYSWYYENRISGIRPDNTFFTENKIVRKKSMEKLKEKFLNLFIYIRYSVKPEKALSGTTLLLYVQKVLFSHYIKDF